MENNHNKYQSINMRFKNTYGLLGSIIVSGIVLFVFYGFMLKAPNSTYFTKSGDGLKSTYGSVYHLNYDTTYLRTSYMNYPFGESVFFTGGQPAIINGFKLLKSVGIDFSDHILGILNIWMLLSIVFGALILYLICRELKLPVLYSIAVSTIIAFLSPQLDRFGGHFNLAYVFFIPLIIYLFLLFHKKRSIIVSILIGLLALLALCTHAYFFGFFAFVSLVFWGFTIITDKKSSGKISFVIFNILIQFILPFVIFQILVWSSTDVGDRTSYPWGFFSFLSYIHGIFLPINKSYGSFIKIKMPPWESIAYVGFVASVGFFTLFIHSVKNIRKKITNKSIFQVTDNTFLNILFWASMVGLVFSFGVPFSTGLKKLFNYMGPLKQFRAPARFSWLFYYSINLIVFYLIWQYHRKKKSLVTKLLIVVVLAWGTYDAYLNVKPKKKYLNNKINGLADRENKTELNQWYNQVNFDDYQAIIPLPYFHIGSENYWVGNGSPIVEDAFIVSMKTGLPLTSVMMGRTSMKQTVMNMRLMMEPYNKYDIIEHWPNDKPFLVLFAKEGLLTFPESVIKNTSRFLVSNEHLEIREIEKSDFEKLLFDHKKQIKNEIIESELFIHDKFLSSDSVVNFIFKGFGNNSPEKPALEGNVYSGNIKESNVLFEKQLNNVDTSQLYTLSFWTKNMDKDLYPRSKLTVSLINAKGENYHKVKYQLKDVIKVIDINGWGLLELNIDIQEPTDILKVSIKNNLMTKGKLVVDELLLKPKDLNIYANLGHIIYKNNRFYEYQE